VTGSYNTTTGAIAETTTDTTVKGFVEEVNDREVNELIQANDRRLTIAAASVTNVPTTTDRVVISGVSYQIIRVKTEEQNNTAITHELILRA
jgi:ribosomal protein L24